MSDVLTAVLIAFLIVATGLWVLMALRSQRLGDWERIKQEETEEKPVVIPAPLVSVKRFIVVPGWVKSENDGERHFISAQSLMSLYGVDPRKCIIVDPGRYETWAGYKLADLQEAGMVVLRPKQNGDYRLPEGING